MFKPCSVFDPSGSSRNVNESFHEQKVISMEKFKSLGNISPLTPKFYMLGPIVVIVYRFGPQYHLHTSLPKHFNFDIKTYIRMTSLRETARRRKQWKDRTALHPIMALWRRNSNPILKHSGLYGIQIKIGKCFNMNVQIFQKIDNQWKAVTSRM